MGCCFSKEEDNFEAKEALLPKGKVEKSSREEQEQIDLSKKISNGHGAAYKNADSTAAPCCQKPVSPKKQAENGAPKAHAKAPAQEEAQAPVESVDLLGLEQSASAPEEKEGVEQAAGEASSVSPSAVHASPKVSASPKKDVSIAEGFTAPETKVPAAEKSNEPLSAAQETAEPSPAKPEAAAEENGKQGDDKEQTENTKPQPSLSKSKSKKKKRKGKK